MLNLRKDFPIFTNEKFLIYFDNAATTQKPIEVINAISNFYSKYNANVHRGIYKFGEYVTVLFEDIRKKVAEFINADANEVIFTTGTTGGINFVALAWANQNIAEGDEIIISQMEHHSNIIPWQQLAKKKKALLKIISVTKEGKLDLDCYKAILSEKTKLVSIIHVSNVFGTTNDIELITKLANNAGAKVLIDAAQSIGHTKVDVKKINCDFLAFSGHKVLGPTGIGILYINQKLHEQIEPYQFGGGMVFEVDFERKSTWLKTPHKFEAGTPPIAAAIGLGAAIDYINNNINFDKLNQTHAQFIGKIINELSIFENITFLGPLDELKQKGHIISFTIDQMHSHDVAAYLDLHGICVRAGHHCAQPLHKALKIESSIRLSFHCYNTIEEVEFFVKLITNLLKKPGLRSVNN